MIYNGDDLARYPICDTDIWVDAILAGLEQALIDKYEKLIVADVVEKEILNFKKSERFDVIAKKFLEYKKKGSIIVIHHSDIDKNERKFLERRLVDFDYRFESGLEDNPHEKNKGEIVSAIYAEYFEIPFLKSNDRIFYEGNMGQVAFPELIVKNLWDMLNDLVTDKGKRKEYYSLIKDNQALMDEEKRIYKKKMNGPVTDEQVQLLLDRIRHN